MVSVAKVGGMAAGLLDARADSSKFLVLFDNSDYDLGTWSKVAGLGVSWEPLEYRRSKGEGGKDLPVSLSPGPAKYTKVSLSRAVGASSRTVQKWLAGTQRKPQIFSGAIVLLGPLGLPLVEWELEAFFPTNWRIGDFDSKAANVVIETLELSHTGFLDTGSIL